MKVLLRLQPDEAAALTAASSAAGQRIAVWIREVALAAAGWPAEAIHAASERRAEAHRVALARARQRRHTAAQ